ncbi:MAG: hypothetical protein ACRD0U_17415 [Acidimicrobiales bacterium]
MHRAGFAGRLTASVGILSVGVLLLGACGGDDDDATPTTRETTTTNPIETTTTTPSDTTTTTVDPQAALKMEVEDSYRAAWNAYRTASDTNDPGFAPFLALFADPELSFLRRNIETRASAGQGVNRPEGGGLQAVKVAEVTSDTAKMRACNVDNSVVFVIATGEVVDDSVSTALVEDSLLRDGLVWRVADRRVVQEWEGYAECSVD